MLNAIKGAIFDLDGTLTDSMGAWDNVDFDYLDRRSIIMPENLGDEVKSMSFRETAEYFKKAFNLPDTVEEIIAEWNDMAFNEYAHNIKLKPNAKDYLSLLKTKGIKIGLATMTGRELVEAVLKNNRVFEYFDAVSTSNDISRGKTFPDIYLLTAERLRLEPEECMVFEDILPAVLSAKKAGMKVIGVYDKWSEPEREDIERHVDRYIMGFHELLEHQPEK